MEGLSVSVLERLIELCVVVKKLLHHMDVRTDKLDTK